MSKFISAFLFLVILLFSFAFQIRNAETKNWNKETPVYDILKELGESPYQHEMEPNSTLVQQGEDLVKLGRTSFNRKRKSKYISKYYACTSCHNLQQEDPDLRVSNPETRLPYVKEKGIPFLQGTTFKGIVNRVSWYNDDYVKKYGDEKIKKAHTDLRESIQLCAIECSQGRPLDKWEEDAILAYYWTLQFRLGDLDMTAQDLEKLNTEATDETKKEALRTWIKSFYNQTSPAHFFDSPPNKKEGYPGLVGNPDVGKDIYELSCLYCHQDGGVSHYTLDSKTLSFRDIRRMITRNSHFSLYQIIPYGTYAIPGHKPYMPHYPLERMSKQQVEDLRAYVELEAN